MDNFTKVGLAIFLVGLIPMTIGGMISFVTRYEVHNRHIRMEFDPVRPKESVSPREFWDAHFSNPKSKWWCRIGFSMVWVGMAILVFGRL